MRVSDRMETRPPRWLSLNSLGTVSSASAAANGSTAARVAQFDSPSSSPLALRGRMRGRKNLWGSVVEPRHHRGWRGDRVLDPRGQETRHTMVLYYLGSGRRCSSGVVFARFVVRVQE
jgi:hypothetical protein